MRLLGATALAFLITGGTAAAGHQALERYRPVLRYDADERYFAQPVDLDAEVRDGDRVYGHLAEQDGERWLQYWFFYAYNPQDRGLLKTGRHEGDWELFQLRLDPGGAPALATLVQHTWAEGCGWDELELARAGGRDVPVLYVASGSHAIYSRPGTHDRPWPDPNDESDGEGREVRPSLTAIEEGSPAWVDRDEPWGDSRAGFIPGEQSSPPGPMFQADDPWHRPTSFHQDRARPCRSDPPGRLWLTALVVIGASAIGVALVARRRRRA